MPTPLELVKAFHVSKMNHYFDGDPQPYIMDSKVPPISSPVETFDSSSTGGPMDIADGYRKYVNGDGEIKFEQVSSGLLIKLYDSTKVQNVKIAMAVNSLNPQLGVFLPLPMEYTLGAHFYEVDEGNLKQGGKREGTAKFKLYTYKVSINLIPVIDFDFLNSKFVTGPADLLAAVQAII
jgi:phage tail tube protein FII